MKKKLPNIILIVLDTVGAKHMSLYGYHRRTTPNLERIAEECTVYNRCFAPSCWTIPSHASMFTGLYPSQHGSHEGNHILNENVQHLVSILKLMGYCTIGISSNFLVSPATGLCRGFDFFKDYSGSFFKRFLNNPEDPELSKRLSEGNNSFEKVFILLQYISDTKRYKEALKKFYNTVQFRTQYRLKNPLFKSIKYTDNTIKLVSDIISKYSNKNTPPFFLFINFMEAHEVYNPPMQYRRYSRWYDKQYFWNSNSSKLNYMNSKNLAANNINLYDDEILCLDFKLSKLWSLLKKFPQYNNTLIIITSDHGEHFGEKDLYGHSLSLYNELIWVPLIVRYPTGSCNENIKTNLVSLTDLYSTILDISESPMPKPDTSISLLCNTKRELAISQYIYPEAHKLKIKKEIYKKNKINFSPPTLSVITSNGNKLIKRRNGNYELYDINKDMNENDNLFESLKIKEKSVLNHFMETIEKDTDFIKEYQNIKQKNNKTSITMPY